jgi:hypothetical protein
MKKVFSLAVLGAFTLASITAVAAPVKLTKAEMDKVVAGVSENGAYTPATQTGPYGQVKSDDGKCNNCTTTPANYPGKYR